MKFDVKAVERNGVRRKEQLNGMEFGEKSS